MRQKIDKLTNREQAWITSQLQAAAQFVETFSPQHAGRPPTLGALDRAFAAWLGTDQSDTAVVNGTINCVGVAFGQFLVDGADLQWVIATDDHGSDLAVQGLPGDADVLVHPPNFVAKRWERREAPFLEASYRKIVAQVAQLKQTPGVERKTKPWWKLWCGPYSKAPRHLLLLPPSSIVASKVSFTSE